MARSRLRATATAIVLLALAVLARPLLAEGRPGDPVFALPVAAALMAAPQPAPEPEPALLPAAPDPLIWFAPGGGNQGTENLALALAAIALQGNEPLYVSDGWGRTTGSTSSDHSIANGDAWAVDLAVRGIQEPTPQTEEAARRVAAAVGSPDWAGGDLRLTIAGYRFQILWKVAGHFNHVHVGVRFVGGG